MSKSLTSLILETAKGSENIEILPILLATILKIKMTLNAIFIITNQFLTSK
jgi:hypothetical protein